MKNEKLNIIIISNEAWGDVWFSKHHYAHELSKKHNIFFIDPPKKWRVFNLFKRSIQSKEVFSNLHILNYSNFLPYKLFRINNKVVSRRIKSFFKRKGIIPDIFWTFDPLRLFQPELLGVRKSIFHVVDKYLFSFPTELILHKNVDGFIIVAEEFRSQYQDYGKPILFIPHGVPSDSDKVTLNLKQKNYIFYMGMIDGRLDYSFIERLLMRFPDETFLFLGDIKNVTDPIFIRIFIDKKYPNLIHHSAVHALQLSNYIENAKCCIAPMDHNWAGNMISHHKILQYMAHGKAVFSPVFTAYSDFSDLLYMDNDKERLINSLKSFLLNGENSELNSMRMEYTSTHTYSHHANEIINFVNHLGHRK